MNTPEKLQRTFVREEAYHILRNWIVEGKLAPGQKLRDKELAEQLGVSRTPVREALLRLEDESLVQTKPNSSTRVSPIDFHSATHLYSITWTLEPLALQQFFEHISDESVHAMVTANDQLLEALQKNDQHAAFAADNAFHAVFIVGSQNSELQKILADLKSKLQRLELHYFTRSDDALLSYEEHLHIINALKKRDLALAQKCLASNWHSSFTRLSKQIEGKKQCRS